MITREFALPEQSGFSVVFVSCTAPSPLADAERARMEAVLDSLTILPRDIQPAQRDDPAGNWTDPTGKFTLRLSGWTPFQTSTPAPGQVLSAELHRQQVSGTPSLECRVTERAATRWNGSQIAANARVEHLGDADILRMFPGALNINHDRLGNMPVVSFTQSVEGLLVSSRIFVLVTDTSALIVILACGGEPPLNDDERESMAGFLGSLEFISQSQH